MEKYQNYSQLYVLQIQEMMRWADKERIKNNNKIIFSKYFISKSSSQDGDGKVGFDEFLALMSSTARGHSDSSL